MNSYDIAKIIKKVELAAKQVLLLILFSKILFAIKTKEGLRNHWTNNGEYLKWSFIDLIMQHG